MHFGVERSILIFYVFRLIWFRICTWFFFRVQTKAASASADVVNTYRVARAAEDEIEF